MPDAIKRVSLGNPAAVAFINRRSERGELCLVLELLALQSA
jgi:hypothetical protein